MRTASFRFAISGPRKTVSPCYTIYGSCRTVFIIASLSVANEWPSLPKGRNWPLTPKFLLN